MPILALVATAPVLDSLVNLAGEITQCRDGIGRFGIVMVGGWHLTRLRRVASYHTVGHLVVTLASDEVLALLQHVAAVSSRQSQTPEVVESHLRFLTPTRVATEHVVDLVFVVIDELMGVTWAWLQVD